MPGPRSQSVGFAGAAQPCTDMALHGPRLLLKGCPHHFSTSVRAKSWSQPNCRSRSDVLRQFWTLDWLSLANLQTILGQKSLALTHFVRAVAPGWQLMLELASSLAWNVTRKLAECSRPHACQLLAAGLQTPHSHVVGSSTLSANPAAARLVIIDACHEQARICLVAGIVRHAPC